MQDTDVERVCAARGAARELRRIARALEDGRAFRLRVAGKRVRVPADAQMEIQLQREEKGGEFEIEINWKRDVY